jgi:hypothetical protein
LQDLHDLEDRCEPLQQRFAAIARDIRIESRRQRP